MGNLISPKIKVVRVIILKYVLGYVFLQYNKQGFHRKGNITKLSDVRLESFGSIWKTVTDRGDAVPGSKASSKVEAQMKLLQHFTNFGKRILL